MLRSLRFPAPKGWAKFNAVSIAALLVITSMSPGSVGAVRGGKEGDHLPKTVFAAAFEDKNGKLTNAATVQSAKYPRCFVSAGHVLGSGDDETNKLYKGGTIMAGKDVREVTDAIKRQKMASRVLRSHDLVSKDWYDVGVAWAENKDKGAENPNPIKIEDYEPAEIGSTAAFEAGKLAWDTKKELINRAYKQPEWEAKLHKASRIVGYGINTTVKLPKEIIVDDFYIHTHEDRGGSIKREGSVKAVGYYTHPDRASSGALFKVAPNPELACKGDSGSAFWIDGKIVGVTSTAQIDGPNLIGIPKPNNPDAKHYKVMNYCSEILVNTMAAFNATTDKKGNFDWINEQIDLNCKVKAEIKEPVNGRVEGAVVAGSFDPFLYNELNDTVDCSGTADDCVEYMHSGESLVLTAAANTGYRFKEWSHVEGPKEYIGGNWRPIDQCPCVADKENPECALPYQSLGYYSATQSFDQSSCIARFVPEECGDEIVQTPEEACDDGEQTAACDFDCSLPVCGDSVLNTLASEQCDDGNTSNGDGCNSACQIETNYCGDGIKGTGEECDEGIQNGSGLETSFCNADCTLAECGDSVLNESAGEDCDDGNDVNGDGCNAYCMDESCGNGVIDGSGEECDEGEATATCTAACETSSCGDGELNTVSESCDDGNDDDGDGCSSECLVEDEVCGDGNVDTGEQCDDAGVSATCNADCTTPMCGDGEFNFLAGEECDDGNLVNSDGCSSSCENEEAYCGDGTQDTGEECDDGNLVNGDGCFLCQTEVCGDGFVQTGEECDDGNTADNDGCDDACQIETLYCGNGDIDHFYEQCDDGNIMSNDGCSAACQAEYCGDGVVQTGEYCDAVMESGTCDADCSMPVCGDGELNISAGEQCDDGNLMNGDGCSMTCQLPSSSSSSSSSMSMPISSSLGISSMPSMSSMPASSTMSFNSSMMPPSSSSMAFSSISMP